MNTNFVALAVIYCGCVLLHSREIVPLSSIEHVQKKRRHDKEARLETVLVSSFLGQLLRVDLIKLVSMSIYTSVRACSRPSTKSFPNSNEIWFVGRGQRVMHDGVPYDPIQGQGQGHETLNLGNSAIFKIYLIPHFQCELVNDCQFLN